MKTLHFPLANLIIFLLEHSEPKEECYQVENQRPSFGVKVQSDLTTLVKRSE